MSKFEDYPNGGVYLLKIYLAEKAEITIGALGKKEFPAGFYFYAGTAQKNLAARVKRHYSSEKKKHWHIDYLLKEAEIKDDYIFELPKNGECQLTQFLKKQGAEFILANFGASDCNCNSHLSYFPAKKIAEIVELLNDNNLEDKFK